MDTNSNIPPQKTVVKIEILDLDHLGYGPAGKHTRREWRAECLSNLLSGKKAFEDWQDSWTGLIESSRKGEYFLKGRSFQCILTYEDGSSENAFHGFGEKISYTLDFCGHTFVNGMNICDYIYKTEALFAGSTFNRPVNFENSEFKSQVNFYYSKFHDRANFNNINIIENIDIRYAVFSKSAIFTNARFNGDAYFVAARFMETADFTEAIFNKVSFFVGVIFDSGAYFSKAKFSNLMCFFQESTFKGNSSFENAVFENVGHFEDARFMTHSPSFRGCKTDSTRLEFSDDSYFPMKESSRDAVKNISFLKRLADEHGQTDQALNFNAMELRAKRLQNIPKPAAWSFRITTWLYEILSNYGRSFVRPIFWYGVLICLSALFAMIYSTYSDSPAVEQQVLCKPIKDQPPPLKLPYGRAVVEYAMFRAGGLMDFTDTGKQNNAVNCRLFEEPIEPPLMRAWGIFKGIASIALLFLAALGLRNKYRIK